MALLKTSVKALGVSAFLLVVLTTSTFATSFSKCIEEKYPNLSTTKDDTHPLKCVTVKTAEGTETIYAKYSSDCASAGAIASDPDGTCPGETTTTTDYNYDGLEQRVKALEEENEKLEKRVGALEEANDAATNNNEKPTSGIMAIAAIGVSVFAIIIALVAVLKGKSSKPAMPQQPTVTPPQNNPYIQQ